MNIMFCGDTYVYEGMLLAISSLIKFNKTPINVYILTAKLTDINPNYKPLTKQHISTINKLLKETNSESKCYLLDITKQFKPYAKTYCSKSISYSPYAFIRLFADKINGLPSKILYLDCDIIINDSLQSLYNINIEKYELAAVIDFNRKNSLKNNFYDKKPIDVPFELKGFLKHDFETNPIDFPFNSGVMLLNLNKIKETNLFNKSLETILNNQLLTPDQSALNYHTTLAKVLPRKFNEQERLKKDTVIHHFNPSVTFGKKIGLISVKPWQIEKIHALGYHYFDDVYNKVQKIINNNKI